MYNFKTIMSEFDDEPEEQRFFKKLFEKFDESCIQKTVKKRMKEARNIMNEAIQQYFQSLIIMNAALSATENPEVSELCDVFPLHLKMIKNYLPGNKDSTEIKPLGLSQEDLSRTLNCTQLSKADHSLFVKHVEKKLDEICSKLIEYASVFDSVLGIIPSTNWRKSFDGAMKTLEHQAKLLNNDETPLPSEKLFREMQQTYCNELLENLTLLNKMLSLHKERLNFESCATENYSLKCEGLQSKIKLFELQILKATYTKETVPALTKIRDQLDTKTKNLQEELTEKKGSVEEYRRLGENFESLVKEYTYLTKCITEKKWAYDELKRRTETKSDS